MSVRFKRKFGGATSGYSSHRNKRFKRGGSYSSGRSFSKQRTIRRPYFQRPSNRKSSSYDQIALYTNPFSTATTNPKIPDGKATHSSGIRLQSVKEFTNDDSGYMDFLIYPGLTGGLVAFNIKREPGIGNPDTLMNDKKQVMSYHEHSSYKIDEAKNDEVIVGQVEGYHTAKWRLVSQGVKLTLINNSDESDGWWEAVRVNNSVNALPYCFNTTKQGTELVHNSPSELTVGEKLDLFPNPGKVRAAEAAGAGTLVEYPTYQTGKLRDLHKFMFTLKPQGKDHDFITMLDNVSLPLDTGDQWSASQFDEMKKNLVRSTLDDSFDYIFIRVHGRTDGNLPTRIMAHVVSNQELIYDDESSLKRFHTETATSPAFPIIKNKLSNSEVRPASRVSTDPIGN